MNQLITTTTNQKSSKLDENINIDSSSYTSSFTTIMESTSSIKNEYNPIGFDEITLGSDDFILSGEGSEDSRTNKDDYDKFSKIIDRELDKCEYSKRFEANYSINKHIFTPAEMNDKKKRERQLTERNEKSYYCCKVKQK